MEEEEEELRLQAAALQTANSIFLARQRAEQELIRTKEALEARTEALARARADADAARRAAQEANEAKGRFVNMISHELRTPLGAIGGYSALLAEGIQGELTAGQREYIERIRHNQAHIVRLVDELLDLAKIEAGQFPLKLGPVSVRGVLDSVQTMIEPQANARQLRLEVPACDTTLSLHADAERVKQIVLNLLSNAVKFTPPRGVVQISAEAAGDRVHMRVRDSGIGIPGDKLDAIFEPFFQVESTPSRAGSGTGLGLAISRELARAMQGDLTVESEFGRGSTFTLSLPSAPLPPHFSMNKRRGES